MPSYRLYRLDGAGKITGAEWIEADSDSDARDHALMNGKSPIIELWNHDRLIVRIEGGRDVSGA